MNVDSNNNNDNNDILFYPIDCILLKTINQSLKDYFVVLQPEAYFPIILGISD
jgi:hypothetical protein